jgi:hypothetical protein
MLLCRPLHFFVTPIYRVILMFIPRNLKRMVSRREHCPKNPERQ